MDLIDSFREKKIFNQRMRNEWIDSFVKRYIQMKGEEGPKLKPEEYKKANIHKDVFMFLYEKLRV
jgi:hypothetical protein